MKNLDSFFAKGGKRGTTGGTTLACVSFLTWSNFFSTGTAGRRATLTGNPFADNSAYQQKQAEQPMNATERVLEGAMGVMLQRHDSKRASEMTNRLAG